MAKLGKSETREDEEDTTEDIEEVGIPKEILGEGRFPEQMFSVPFLLTLRLCIRGADGRMLEVRFWNI